MLFCLRRVQWVAYDKDGKVFGAAGGSYTLKGETYEETPEYGFSADFETIKGKAHAFKAKVEGVGVPWLAWLSWQDFWAEMAAASQTYLPAADLTEILRLKGLNRLDGFHCDRPWEAPHGSWQFYHPWLSPHRSWAPLGDPHKCWTAGMKQ